MAVAEMMRASGSVGDQHRPGGTAGWLLLGSVLLLAGLATVPAARAARVRIPENSFA